MVAEGEALHHHCPAAHLPTHLTVLSMLTDARRSAVVGSHLTMAMELVCPTRSVSDRSGRPCEEKAAAEQCLA